MWSLEKLKDWARPALRYEELVEIARTAPSAKQAKNQALEFTENRGLEEEIAKACRWLMIIRRDYGQEVQEEYISSAREELTQENLKPKQEKQKMEKKSGSICEDRKEFVFNHEFDPQDICEFLGKQLIDPFYVDPTDSQAIGISVNIGGIPAKIGISFSPEYWDEQHNRWIICRVFLRGKEIGKFWVERIERIWWEKWLDTNKVIVFEKSEKEKSSRAQLAIIIDEKNEAKIECYDHRWWGQAVG